MRSAASPFSAMFDDEPTDTYSVLPSSAGMTLRAQWLPPPGSLTTSSGFAVIFVAPSV